MERSNTSKMAGSATTLKMHVIFSVILPCNTTDKHLNGVLTP